MTDYFASVPGEIQEAIVDELQDDFGTLISCSLAQRSWVSATRAHIFNPTIISQFPDPEAPRDNATEFLALCRSPHSTILPGIKTAVLHIDSTTLLEEVVAELAKAAALKKVIFLDRGLTEAALEKLQQLSDIEEIAYSPFGDFGEKEVRLVASFPRLRTLAIYLQDTVRHIAFPPPLPRETGCFAHLRTLRLCLYDPEQLFQWLLDSHSEIALATLDLRVLGPPHRGWGSVSALNTFLETQAKTLTDLSLSVKYLYDGKNRAVTVHGT
ncbi:hypothetical protein EST38_g5452 [Candolleomyces aberdarensis]|uniref:F-box domain-containing protein n=1 Tax=Candolleomyces aberdarensis TaxID=2316362 RepID=A0A4Q2DNM8_9AGAR|nr:hypothetical protein EST38_g5452 [Candolleomyces aberdarensis]